MTLPRRLSQEDERRLLSRLRARDEAALGELYDQLAPWVLGLAFRILGDDDEAEEVVSDVFEHVWNRIGQHDPARGPLVPWVLSIARHRALDLLRRRRRWERRAAAAGAEQSADDSADPNGREAGVPGWPVHQAVHAALAALPEEQRAVVRLAYFAGMSHTEIAARTGLPLGTVKTRMRLAQQRLAESLEFLKDWMT
ncbi:MAG: sigma-70 family RNA polymerase sigma factor [Gemmatimonadota bacterium]|nr:sigma-70 family RNA polymerase sigma factor [Gemmatimonadota bacterium]